MRIQVFLSWTFALVEEGSFVAAAMLILVSADQDVDRRHPLKYCCSYRLAYCKAVPLEELKGAQRLPTIKFGVPIP